MIARYLLGIIFLVFGLNGFIGFMPMPPMEGQAAAFMGAFAGSGWIVAVKIFEITSAIALLANRFTSLALIFLSAISLNIFLFHALLAPGNLPMAIVLVVLCVLVFLGQKDDFKAILSA